tara:strand:+ start:320 stop:469 length:150 start_codon:yes stop_codon:yes gene_type:complete
MTKLEERTKLEELALELAKAYDARDKSDAALDKAWGAYCTELKRLNKED